MKRKLLLFVFTASLLVAMTASQMISPVVEADDGIDGNAACTSCLDQAEADRQACYAAWDYGEKDPECDAKYNRAVTSCQLTFCIY